MGVVPRAMCWGLSGFDARGLPLLHARCALDGSGVRGGPSKTPLAPANRPSASSDILVFGDRMSLTRISIFHLGLWMILTVKIKILSLSPPPPPHGHPYHFLTAGENPKKLSAEHDPIQALHRGCPAQYGLGCWKSRDGPDPLRFLSGKGQFANTGQSATSPPYSIYYQRS